MPKLSALSSLTKNKDSLCSKMYHFENVLLLDDLIIKGVTREGSLTEGSLTKSFNNQRETISDIERFKSSLFIYLDELRRLRRQRDDDSYAMQFTIINKTN